jgi:hypothetical protein
VPITDYAYDHDVTDVETLRPETFTGLMEALGAIKQSDHHHHFRSEWLYRGMTDSSWKVKSSLDRLGAHAASVERSLLRNFRRYAGPGVSVDGDCFWNDLAVAQHHGLPTRLIDWSNSPLVALHFAIGTEPDSTVDGVIWMCNLRTINLLPSELRAILQRDSAYVFTSDMLDGIVSLDEFDAMRAHDDFILVLEPPALDARITNQYAMLTALPSPSESVTDFLVRHPNYGRRIVVPGELKWEVRDKLDQFNITERMLFPGLDGLSSWLRRYYSSGPGPDPSGSTNDRTSMWDRRR